MKITLSAPIAPPHVLEVTEEEYEIIRKALNRYARHQKDYADHPRCSRQMILDSDNRSRIADAMSITMFAAAHDDNPNPNLIRARHSLHCRPKACVCT